MVKKFLFSGLVVCLLLGLVLGVVSAGSYPVAIVYVGYYDTTSNFGFLCEVFEAQCDIELTEIKMLLRRYQYGDKADIYLRLYALDEYNEQYDYWPFKGEPLAEETYTDAELIFIYGDDWEDCQEYIWINANAVSEGIVLEDGLMYAVVVGRTSGTGTVVWARASVSMIDFGQPAIYWSGPPDGASGVGGPEGDLNFQVLGYWTDKSSVSTLPGYFDSSGALVLSGMVHSIGPDDKVKAYIDFGVVEEFGNEKDCGLIDAPGAAGLFKTRLFDLPEGLTIYYRARIVGLPSGVERVGVTKDILCPSGNVSLTARLIENSPEQVGFEVVVVDMGGYGEVSLNISYGACYGDYLHNPDYILVADAVTDRGVYIVYDYDSFEEGTTYYFGSLMIHEGDVVARSDFHSFTRYDTSQPGIVNKIVYLIDWLGWGGGMGGTMAITWFWWIVLFVLLCAAWILSAKLKQKWVGVVGSFVVVALMVALDLVDIWLVVLLSIVAGFIIYKLIFKKSGVSGGG